MPHLHVNSKTPEFTAIFLLNFAPKIIHQLDLVFACTFCSIGICKFVLEMGWGGNGWINFTDASTIVSTIVSVTASLEIYSL